MCASRRASDHPLTLFDRNEHGKSNLRAKIRHHSKRDNNSLNSLLLPRVVNSSYRKASSFETESFSGSFEELKRSMSAIYSDDYNATQSSSSYDRKVEALPSHHHKHLLSSRKATHNASSLSQWMAELRIYTVYDINTSIVRDGTNTCIKIKQNGITLGKTTVKPSSSQQVWEQTLSMQLLEMQSPLLLKFCSRKAGQFSTLGIAQMPLNECLVNVTYSKHLEIIGIEKGDPIGMLRAQVVLRAFRDASHSVKRNSSVDEYHRTCKTRLRLKQRTQSLLNYIDINSSKRGPLIAGVKIFEARYLGLLLLNVVSRPFDVYARRWSPLKYRPGEVSVITNPLTKATEIVSPRLPWPPHLLRGTSALEFDPVLGPQVAQFDSAVLYLNVLSACCLQYIPISKFLNKCITDEDAVESTHTGVMVAQLISYSQTMAKNARPLSTQVHLQMGKERYMTSIQKSTYKPVWNQTFTFPLTSSSKTLIEIQLMSIANPNISGPAAGVQKIGETLIDISRLPMDFTQQIEIELNCDRPKPRLLLLATLTGLSKNDSIDPLLSQPLVMVTSPEDSIENHSDLESSNTSFQSPQPKTLMENFSWLLGTTTPGFEGGTSVQMPSESQSLDETDAQIAEHYSWKMALKDRFDIGFLRVKVIAASGLMAKDLNGRCDPYCLLELINMRAQTHAARKTLNPIWQKVFVFPVTDIHAVLYATVKDDEKSKTEILGRVAIPLMKIRNHDRAWYALKNADLTERSQGSILLEFYFVYNYFKAAWRACYPIENHLNHPLKPKKYSKLSSEYRTAIQDNIMRLKVILRPLGMVLQVFDDICSWENPWYTLATLIIYNAVVWNFQSYMLPLGMIVGILARHKTSENPYVMDAKSSARVIAGIEANNMSSMRNSPSRQSVQNNDDGPSDSFNVPEAEYRNFVLLNDVLSSTSVNKTFTEEEQQETEKNTTESKGSKQGIKKFNAIMEVVGDLPRILNMIASAIEKIIGIFEWEVPWLTWFCLIFLAIFTLLLYCIPMRLVLCLLGTNQLTRKLLRPNARYTPALFNVISRVPSKPEAKQHRRLPPKSFVYH